MPHIRFHDLRHSIFSYLYNTGTDLKAIQGMAGHSTLQVTEKIYVHPDKNIKKKTAASVGNIFKVAK